MADLKPKFDPNKPFDVVEEKSAKPKFDPNKPFEVVSEQPSSIGSGKILNESSEISPVDRAFVKNFGGSEQDKIDYLKSKPEYKDWEIQSEPKQGLIIRKPGEKDFKKLDPGGRANLNPVEMIQDVADVGYDVLAGTLSTVASGASGIAGGVASGGAGAIPAAMAGGAASSAALEGLRQGIGNILGTAKGADVGDIALSGAIGGVAPVLLGTGASKSQIASALKSPSNVSNVLKRENLGFIKQGAKATAEDIGMAKEALTQSQRGILSRGLEGGLSAFAGTAPAKTLRNATAELKKPMVNLLSKIVKVDPNRKWTSQEMAEALTKQDKIVGFGDNTLGTFVKTMDEQQQKLATKYADGLEKMGVEFEITSLGDDLLKQAEFASASSIPEVKEIGSSALKLHERFFGKPKLDVVTGRMMPVTVKPKEAQMLMNAMKNWSKVANSKLSRDAVDANQKMFRQSIDGAQKLLEDKFYKQLEKVADKGLKQDYKQNKDFLRNLYPKMKDAETAAKNLMDINNKNKAGFRASLKAFDQKYMKDKPVKMMDLANFADVVKFFGDPSLEAISSGGATSTGKILRAGDIMGTTGWLAAQASGTTGLQPMAAQVGRTIGQMGTSPAIVSKILKGKVAGRRALEKAGVGKAAQLIERLKGMAPEALQPAFSPQAATQSVWNMMGGD